MNIKQTAQQVINLSKVTFSSKIVTDFRKKIKRFKKNKGNK